MYLNYDKINWKSLTVKSRKKVSLYKAENNYSCFSFQKKKKMLQGNCLLIQHLSPFNLVCPLIDKITQLKGFPFELSVSEVKMACVL